MQHGTSIRRGQGGQAMFMLTVALFALCGMMGLAVDLGWSFFVKKAAQSAADAAAMAAVQEAVLRGIPGGFTCGSVNGVYCATSAVACGSVLGDANTFGNLYNGCKYAETNGFTTGGHANRQIVSIQSNDITTLPPGAPGVNDIRYWVSVSITETVPQLFSAVLGNPNGQVTARATAGAVQVAVPGSFYSLNRERDCMGTGRCGVNVDLGGGSTLRAPAGLVMASSCSGRNNAQGCDDEAGIHNGNAGVVQTPSIQIRSTGTADSNTAFPGWTNGAGGPMFQDPTRGRSQPPIVATDPVKTCGIPNGQITQSGNNPVILGPYNYYSYRISGNQVVPLSAPIVLNGNDIRFSPTGTCPGLLSITGVTQTSSFPAYFFYGGMRATNGTNLEFGSGQYVMVGAPLNGSSAGPVFESGGGNASMTTAAGATNMFIFTAPGTNPYPGLSTQLNISEIQRAATNLYQGYVDVKAGNSSSFALTGYEKGEGPASLDDHNGVLFWQDRRNSTIKYNADGTFNCAGPDYVTGCTKSSAELEADRVIVGSGDSRRMSFDAGANLGTNTTGVLYQPRGAWMSFQGHGDVTAGLQVITGALEMQGGGSLLLSSPSNPLLQFVVALIE